MASDLGFGVWGLGLRVKGFCVWRVGVRGLGFGVRGVECGVCRLGFGGWGLGLEVLGLGFTIWCAEFRDRGLCF